MAKLTPESAWEFADAIKAIVKPQTTRRKATVQSVDKDGTIWVSLPGSSTVTPIQSTGANVSPGDTVLTELRGTSLHITENQTNPAIGENTARSIAKQETQHAEAMAKQAKTIADEANAVAEATNQHFFADDNGAHITDVTQDEWNDAVADNFSDYDPTTKPYHNQLLNSLGILLRTALNNLVSITRSAIAFYDGTGNTASNIVARFGSDGAQIGLTDESHLSLDYHSMQMVDKEGGTYLHVSDVRDINGAAVLTGVSDSKEDLGVRYACSFYTLFGDFSFNPHSQDDIESVTATAVLSDSSTVEIALPLTDKETLRADSTLSGYYCYLDTGQTSIAGIFWQVGLNAVPGYQGDGVYVTITYNTTSQLAKVFTFGTRDSGDTVGFMSASVGINNNASGFGSAAFGRNSEASGRFSSSEGDGTAAKGECSHSEGYNSESIAFASHSEGRNCSAGGYYSHAEGWNSKTKGERWKTSNAGGYYGWGAHAQNVGTIASRTAQTAIGSWNIEDTTTDTSECTHDGDLEYGKYALIIGNGTADNARSNAFAVDWDGYLYPCNEKMPDFVVAQGTSGIWTYRKWHSGIAECWGIYTASMAINLASTTYGGYRSAEITVTAYPFTFTAQPAVSAIMSYNSQGAWVNNAQSSTAANFKFYLSAGASLSAANRGISIHATGRWK